VADAELVVICTPVGQIAADVCSAAAHCRPGTLITDAGSTKAEIVARLEGSLPQAVEFVGSHPLAGGEKSGPAAARADLFVDRVVVVTPTDTTSAQALAAIEELWASLGAKVVRMTADEHDRQVAATSHLPHLAAAALAAATPEEFADLVARGWLDTTRVASGDPQLWTQIFLANRAHVLTTLARYGKVLSSFGEALERSDATALERILAEGKQARDALGS
jgi:prephenate dehydrogenase